MPNSDVSKTLRNVLYMLRRILDNPYVTKEQLAGELRVNERTIRRYRKTLEAAGYHLETDIHGHFKRFIRLTPDARRAEPLQMLTLKRKELMLLFLRLSGIQSVGEPGLRDQLWEKIRLAMQGESVNTQRLSGMLTGFDKAYKSYEGAKTKKAIARLVTALYRRNTCEVVYRSANAPEPSTFQIEPYQMFEFDGGLYCFVHVPYYKNVIMLAVERIVEIEINEDQEFVRKKAIEKRIAEKKERAFRIFDDEKPLKVKLKFSPQAAFYVNERIWHPSETKTQHKDGSVTLQFTASGRVEIERWIRGWGEECEVLGMG